MYVCVSWLLFTFSPIESTGHCPEIPTSHAPPISKPKPKPKKAPLPPKNAIAASTASSHKGNEAPHAKKKGKAPAKQPPLPPPKPAGASANREAGEYCPCSAAAMGACAWGCLAGLTATPAFPRSRVTEEHAMGVPGELPAGLWFCWPQTPQTTHRAPRC